jgi:deoxyribonuclease-4
VHELLFGPSGVPHSAAKPTSEAGIRQVKKLQLGAMEMAFVHSVSIGEESARKLSAVARTEGVALSIHAPYYINLNSREPDKVAASKERILKAARAGSWAGARNIALHLAFYHGDPPADVYGRVRDGLVECLARLSAEGICDVILRPEVMGGQAEFGTLDEVLDLSVELEGVLPCVDFAHLHARSAGGYNTYVEFAQVLRRIEERLGRRGLDDAHIHVSGIAYGPKGERNHLVLQESDFNYSALLQALIDFEVKGLVICESPNQEDDALLLQQTYHTLFSAPSD